MHRVVRSVGHTICLMFISLADILTAGGKMSDSMNNSTKSLGEHFPSSSEASDPGGTGMAKFMMPGSSGRQMRSGGFSDYEQLSHRASFSGTDLSMKSTASSLEMMRLNDMREEDKDRLIHRLQVLTGHEFFLLRYTSMHCGRPLSVAHAHENFLWASFSMRIFCTRP